MKKKIKETYENYKKNHIKFYGKDIDSSDIVIARLIIGGGVDTIFDAISTTGGHAMIILIRPIIKDGETTYSYAIFDQNFLPAIINAELIEEKIIEEKLSNSIYDKSSLSTINYISGNYGLFYERDFFTSDEESKIQYFSKKSYDPILDATISQWSLYAEDDAGGYDAAGLYTVGIEQATFFTADERSSQLPLTTITTTTATKFAQTLTSIYNSLENPNKSGGKKKNSQKKRINRTKKTKRFMKTKRNKRNKRNKKSKRNN